MARDSASEAEPGAPSRPAGAPASVAAFRQRELDRTLLFGRGALAEAGELLGDGYTLLSTPRAVAAAPDVAAAAPRTIEVPAGRVDAIAGDLLAAEVDLGPADALLVALGGGRVVDVTKALAAASTPPRVVAAIPTTASGAEMTARHRRARGAPAETPFVRPAIVVNDPALSASHAVPDLAASSANALGHVLIALTSDRATPFSSAVAREAAQRFARAWGGAGSLTDTDRDEIALGALLAGWAVDQSGLGFHHALAQTVVREADVAHAVANAALLPESVIAVHGRRPEPLDTLDAQLPIDFLQLTRLLRAQAGGDGLALLARDETLLQHVVAIAARRTADLAHVPPPLDETEIRRLYEAAAAASA
ncbi:iron-containing alcohol dehydrogenase [Conexibacter sp. CPCC 206217]|uniref:iron-containing alcohol dehydrogenase n=1 Tax=Conexibacter sp. CPCC 206217 TaxID=3064574 RepID=UPI0027274C57|nr:iron-containing alcohol dehydrogenase [Conexibacter sp. CPCC 206217]MDO8210387.1 iron-containing alcohol dehydrogenase [Conexibacter sp. CPCC 206217]